MISTRLTGGALELLDQATLNRRELRTSLQDVGRLNRWFGGTSAVVSEVGRIIRTHGLKGRISVLDIGAGGADIPRALVRWGERRGLGVEVVACDLHGQVAALAAEFSSDYASIRITQCDAMELPFPAGHFDCVTCSLMLHHLGEQDVIALLEKLRQLPRHALIACDLERSRRGYTGVWLATHLVCRSRMTRHDGPLSVLRAYTLAELRALSRRAGCQSMHWSRRAFFRVVGVLEE